MRRRLSVEPLEPREVPAGVIAVSFVNGALTLIGDDLNNEVNFAITRDTAGAPVVALLPGTDTAIDDPSDPNAPVPGAMITLAGTVTSLKAVLKGGNDTFRLFETGLVLPGGADFDLGDGENSLHLTTTEVIQLGALTVTAGDGRDEVYVQSPAAAGSGITPGPRQDQPVTFAFGPGGYVLDIDSFAVPGLGGLTVSAGEGYGDVVANGLTVAGPVTGQFGNGYRFWNWVGGSAGSLALVGAGPDADVQANLRDMAVIGHVKLTGASMADLSATNTTIGGSVTAKTSPVVPPGPAFTTAEVGLTDSTVAGSLTVSSAGGLSEAALRVTRAGVAGPVAVLTTGANSTAFFGATDARFDEAVRVSASGPGESDADLDWAGTSTARSVTAYGTSRANFDVRGRLTVGDPADPAARGDVRVTGKVDDAFLRISQGELLARHLTVSGYADSEVGLERSAGLGLTGNLSVTSRGEALVRGFHDDATLDVAGTVSVRAPSEAAARVEGSWSSGDVSVVSPGGSAYFELDGTTVRGLGAVTLQGGFGASFTGKPASPAGMGSLRITGGAADDFIQIDQLTIQGVANLNVGGGANGVNVMRSRIVPHAADPRGNLTIATGGATDTVWLSGSEVYGATSIKTGAGRDFLIVEGSFFGGPAQMDLGAGDDWIQIAQPSPTAGDVTFESAVSIQAGAGNDELEMGLSMQLPGGSTKTAVQFQRAGNRIDGGAGADTFDPDAQQALLEPGATLSVTGWEVDP